jgi:hypothetical protein
VKATWEGTVVAESNETEVLLGHHHRVTVPSSSSLFFKRVAQPEGF